MAQAHPDEPAPVRVEVTRTGGLAGLERVWAAEPKGDEASDWAALIESCPWDAATGVFPGADRYLWAISAVCGPEQRRAELADEQLVGAWRELVDAVREWTGRAGPGQPSAR